MTEAEFWGNACNTFHEEQKQLVYAPRMGLVPIWDCAHPPTFDLEGRSVIDIGGGPVSLLLKCVNLGVAVVLDPGTWTSWVDLRYAAHNVVLCQRPGEAPELDDDFDEAWIYNVLQHVEDPALVVANARMVAKTVRVFEWIDIDPYPGHPNKLQADILSEWLGASGFVASLNENGAVGRCFYGVFAA